MTENDVPPGHSEAGTPQVAEQGASPRHSGAGMPQVTENDVPPGHSGAGTPQVAEQDAPSRHSGAGTPQVCANPESSDEVRFDHPKRDLRMYFKMVSSAMLGRPSRMIVALLSVTVGAAMLTGLTALSLGASQQMGLEFRAYGANVVAQAESGTVSPAQADALSELAGDALIGKAGFTYREVSLGERPFTLVSVDIADALTVRPYWRIEGESPTAGQVLLGREVAETMGVDPGEEVAISGVGESEAQSYFVSGILDTGAAEDEYVVVGTNPESYDAVELSITGELAPLVERMNAEVAGVHVTQVKRIAQAEDAVLATLGTLLALVVTVILALTLITVGATMLAVVAERRGEIALKKALGAADREIWAELLGEGLLLGIVGGALGGALGLVLAQALSWQVFGRELAPNPALLAASVVVFALVTVFACQLPARQALATDPAIVLSQE
jgi:putative ABC transport system permease protein